MKKFSPLFIGLGAVVLLTCDLIMLLQNVTDWSGMIILLAAFYVFAIFFGIAGSLLSVKKKATAAKVFAIATVLAIPSLLTKLYLLTSFEGMGLQFTTLGVIFLAIAGVFCNKHKNPL